MNRILLRAMIAFFPICLALVFSVVSFSGKRTIASSLQLFGAACLMLVVVAHICEALGLFPSMRWGLEHSPGHYLDLVSAILGLTLFPVGLFIYVLQRSRQRRNIR
jgi:formate hydrogenlyase subunit 3/multisubunit Na+/H+ antiporter MnhD subunit